MLTPQQVSAHSFAKAVMGGYNMAAVDEFLDTLTDDYTALYKENNALKAKMKVLVEKVAEYRATEDSMRATLLTAQRMADSIVQEAETKRDQILKQAESCVQDKIQTYQNELAVAEERLQHGQKQLSEFITSSRELCMKELAFLDTLPQMPVSLPTMGTPSQVEEIGEEVMAAVAAQSSEEQAIQEESFQEPEQESEDDNVEQSEYPDDNPFSDSLESTRRINLTELKFGRNYNGERN